MTSQIDLERTAERRDESSQAETRTYVVPVDNILSGSSYRNICLSAVFVVYRRQSDIYLEGNVGTRVHSELDRNREVISGLFLSRISLSNAALRDFWIAKAWVCAG